VKGFPNECLEYDKGCPVDGNPRFQRLDNVLVFNRDGKLCFAQHAVAMGGNSAELLRQNLYRDELPQKDVSRQKNVGHAAATDPVENDVTLA
jgi:hypothetical protein